MTFGELSVNDLRSSLTVPESVFSWMVAITQKTAVRTTVSVRNKLTSKRRNRWKSVLRDLEPRLRDLSIDTEKLWWGPMTLSPTRIRFLLDEIERIQPTQVLEAGAGTSTIILSAAAHRYGFEVLSLENDLETIKYVERALDKHPGIQNLQMQLCGFANYRRHSDLLYKWYKCDLSVLRRPIDFVLIDGPMGSLVGRNGALYRLEPYLAPNWRLYLDGCKHAHERMCVEQWQREVTGLNLEILGDLGMYVIAREVKESST